VSEGADGNPRHPLIACSSRDSYCRPTHCAEVNVMGQPPQSQDVEHKGSKINPLDSRQRQSPSASENATPGSKQEQQDPRSTPTPAKQPVRHSEYK
jgi:hypothetical protein